LSPGAVSLPETSPHRKTAAPIRDERGFQIMLGEVLEQVVPAACAWGSGGEAAQSARSLGKSNGRIPF